MATHSSILAWEIPWTEEPGGYSLWSCKELDTTEHTCNMYTYIPSLINPSQRDENFIPLRDRCMQEKFPSLPLFW